MPLTLVCLMDLLEQERLALVLGRYSRQDRRRLSVGNGRSQTMAPGSLLPGSLLLLSVGDFQQHVDRAQEVADTIEQRGWIGHGPDSRAVRSFGDGPTCPHPLTARRSRIATAIGHWSWARNSPSFVEAAGGDVWDITLMTPDPSRAKVADWTAPVFEMEYTYLVPSTSKLMTSADVDRA